MTKKETEKRETFNKKQDDIELQNIKVTKNKTKKKGKTEENKNKKI